MSNAILWLQAAGRSQLARYLVPLKFRSLPRYCDLEQVNGRQVEALRCSYLHRDTAWTHFGGRRGRAHACAFLLAVYAWYSGQLKRPLAEC